MHEDLIAPAPQQQQEQGPQQPGGGRSSSSSSKMPLEEGEGCFSVGDLVRTHGTTGPIDRSLD